MKRIFLGVIAMAAFGIANAQAPTPAPVDAEPVAQDAQVAPAPQANTPTPIVKRKTPRTGLIAAVAGGVLVVAALAGGGGGGDDRPSSP